MCTCEGIGTRKSLKFTDKHTVSTFRYFDPVNFRQSPEMMEICRNPVHTGTPHILCLTTTSIPCVFVNMPESSPNRYPTHTLSHNHKHAMCICESIGTRKSLKFTVIHTVSLLHWFYPINFRQSPSMMEIWRSQVHIGTTHILCLTTTVIICVWMNEF